MTYILYAAVMQFILLFAVLRKYSKIIFLCICVYIIILFGGNSESLDTINYLNHFEQIKMGIGSEIVNHQSEIGYLLLLKMFTFFNINFFSMKVIICTIGLILIHSTVKKYSSNYFYVYFLYFIHGLFMDIEQFRNFIGVSILVYAVRFLIEEERFWKLKYVLLMLVAATFHNSFLLYLPFVFINIKNERNFKKTLAGLIISASLIISLLTFINGNKIPFLDEIASGGSDMKIINYFSRETQFGFIIPWFFHLSNVFLMYITRRTVCSDTQSKLLNQNKVNFVEIVFIIDIVAFVYFPLYMQSITFYRLIRNFNILHFISYSIANQLFIKGTLKKVLYNLFIMMSIFTWFYYDILIRIDEIWIPVMEGNIFLN